MTTALVFVCQTRVADAPYQADAQKLSCYLESSNMANIGLYNKLGFTYQKCINFTRGQKLVPLWLMTRKPNAKPVTPEQNHRDFQMKGIDGLS